MYDFLDLSQRCKLLEKPDRELDADLARATGWIHKCNTEQWGVGAPHWWKDNRCQGEIIGHWHSGDRTSLPFFTASIDAAITLVPEGFMWMVMIDYELAGRARVSNALDKPGKADAFGPAAAIAAAAMQAWHFKESNEDLSDLLTKAIRPDKANAEAMDAVKNLVDSLDIPWWKTAQYHEAIASAYTMGQQSRN